jgi:hypothetical protein
MRQVDIGRDYTKPIPGCHSLVCGRSVELLLHDSCTAIRRGLEGGVGHVQLTLYMR